MSILGKPVFEFIQDLYNNPRTDERWSPPEWQQKDHGCGCAVLGELSVAAWRLVGVMRDTNTILTERLAERGNLARECAELLTTFKPVSYSLTKMLDSQIRADLIAAGVSSDAAAFFNIEQGGTILACQAMRIRGGLNTLFERDAPHRRERVQNV